MDKPHKHAVEIKAWADGAQIQYRHSGTCGSWYNIIEGRNPSWLSTTEYRVRPPEIDAPDEVYVYVYPDSEVGPAFTKGEVLDIEEPTRLVKYIRAYNE